MSEGLLIKFHEISLRIITPTDIPNNMKKRMEFNDVCYLGGFDYSKWLALWPWRCRWRDGGPLFVSVCCVVLRHIGTFRLGLSS